MVLHIGANNHDGGLNEGFNSVLYQPAIWGRVTSEATKPMARVMSKLTSKGKKLNFWASCTAFMMMSLTINKGILFGR